MNRRTRLWKKAEYTLNHSSPASRLAFCAVSSVLSNSTSLLELSQTSINEPSMRNETEFGRDLPSLPAEKERAQSARISTHSW
jgi:hypothetical protein